MTTEQSQLVWRDLNGNGIMDPYENPSLTPQERVDDLVSRLSVEEKVGLMFQTVIETGPQGTLLEEPGAISKSPTSTVVLGKFMNHFNVHQLGTPRETAQWNNALQRLAEQTPHGIPVTVSTDPRHSFVENSGTSFTAGFFSQWPEPLGLGALGDEDIERFANIARQEYVAVGIRAALHPQVDLCTEPRWGRQMHSFSEDPERTSRAVVAYLKGFQGETLGPNSVACVTKHFPGGGPQKDGEDAHFPYGREQVYPGGQFDTHLEPFKAAIAHGTAGVMPYYGMPVGVERHGEAIEEVGFGYNAQVITGILREELGYNGIVVSDWELVNDNHVGDQVLPARAWGVESLTAPERMMKILQAGGDQFGGEECTEILLQLVRSGKISQDRLNESVRRILLVKFQLGLFDNPFVDEDAAETIVGQSSFIEAGYRAQAECTTVLANKQNTLPLAHVGKVYVEGIDPEIASRLGTVVTDPAEADLAIVRLSTPFDQRNDLFLEAMFHQGSLDFPPGLVIRLQRIAAVVPLVIDVMLERPAILTPLLPFASAITASFGSSSQAWVDAVTGTITARGRLPFDIPRSMDAVRSSRSDVPHDTEDPLFHMGDGLKM
ncbi:MAG: glycoside hydrolase family 3 protein [Cellulomonadaceae bacterium]|jgi:beta-glucosidase|nr:glycoside hydrolase family 3 protein [Cellulomonadaceae bacterium]